VGSSFFKTQGGAISIEFACLFPTFFLVFYGLVGYSVPLLLAATYQEVASDALREAIRHHELQLGDPAALRASQEARVREVIAASWLPDTWARPCAGYAGSYLRVAGAEWSVCLRHDAPRSILPPLALFDWEIPSLPEEIRGEASIRIR